MDEQGPVLETLTHRLAECPGEFLMPPRIGSEGTIHVDAVVADLIRYLGGSADKSLTAPFRASLNPDINANKAVSNWLSTVLVTCWLLHDSWFQTEARFSSLAYGFLSNGLQDIARIVASARFVNDQDRREELARLCLAQLGLRPSGESIAVAEDRLATLSSLGRHKVIQAARAAEARALAIREAMKKAAAEEAAAKYTRE